MIDGAYQRMPHEMRDTVTAFLQKYCYTEFEEPMATASEEMKLQEFETKYCKYDK